MFLICEDCYYYYFCTFMAGIYIHIPFCKKRCIYCDFYSTTDNRLMESYIDAICKEFESRITELAPQNITTIYIGGGTPSQLSIQQLSRLVGFIKSKINFNLIEEFTIEVNPDDVNLDYMLSCRELGINRVSMGIQSFVDSELAAINRRHNATQARNAVEIIRNAGFSNISIDLIYGLPTQTLGTWKYSIKEALKLNVPHISCYNLSYEEGTILYKKRESGEVAECSEDDCVKMYETLVNELKTAGYVHYEISNFSLPGKHSRHNSNYWNLTPYLGLGASAHSFNGTARRYNPASITEYIKSINDRGTAFIEEDEALWERYNEYVMINLRTMWGMQIDKVRELFGETYYNHLIKYSRSFIASGELKESDNVLSLTEKGIMLSDYITRALIFVP